MQTETAEIDEGRDLARLQRGFKRIALKQISQVSPRLE
jgi:hypothetical protein